MDIEVEEAEALGIRVHLTRGSMNLSAEDGGLPPRSVVQDRDTILATERVIRRFHDPTDGAMVRVALAPCSPFSVTPDIMIETAALAEKLDVRLHTHLSETEDENEFCREMFGCRPVGLFGATGLALGPTWLAHGIHFNDDEIARLGAAGTGVAIAPVPIICCEWMVSCPRLGSSRRSVGLAVDGSASQDCSNLIQEVRQAMYAAAPLRG